MPWPSLSPSLCVFKVRDDMISSWYLSHNILLSTAVSVLSILYLPVSCSWLFFLWGEKGLWGREGWLREWERESKMVVGGVFFVTLQASKCSQVHSAPWERWRTLDTFVATGMWCTQFAHGNKVRVRRIYYHILSVDVSEAGYNHNMRIPGKFLQGRGDGFRIKTTKSLNCGPSYVTIGKPCTNLKRGENASWLCKI